jgi:hypothetical protein
VGTANSRISVSFAMLSFVKVSCGDERNDTHGAVRLLPPAFLRGLRVDQSSDRYGQRALNHERSWPFNQPSLLACLSVLLEQGDDVDNVPRWVIII